MDIKKNIGPANAEISDLDIFKTNRDKLIRIVLEKITFLAMLFNESKSSEYRERVKLALKKLENLLKIQGFNEREMFDKDYELIKRFVDLTIGGI